MDLRLRVQRRGDSPVAKRLNRERRALPSTLHAAAIDRFGPPSAITLHTLPVPKPGPREILIALRAAGVGIWDESVRDGSWRRSEEHTSELQSLRHLVC